MQINFSKQWDKLTDERLAMTLKHCQRLTSIRWIDKYEYYLDNLEQDFDVCINGKPIAKAMLTGVYARPLNKIQLHEIQKDTHETMTKEEFYKLMEAFYGDKPDWKGTDSMVIMLYFKVTKYPLDQKRICDF